MKKAISLILALALGMSLAMPALAEEHEPWTMFQVESGATEDFDGDGEAETLTLETDLSEYNDGSFVLTVGGATYAQEECVDLEPQVYALQLGEYGYIYGTLFMISENGPSDDPYTYCCLYTEGQLLDVGAIPAMAKHFELHDSIISTRVSIDLLGTWSRPADYELAIGVEWMEEEPEMIYRLVEVPRDIYSMGRITTLQMDLPLMGERADGAPIATLAAGSKVILTATDGVRWVYATSLDGQTRGWFRWRHLDWPSEVNVGGVWMPEDEVFTYLLYAD